MEELKQARNYGIAAATETFGIMAIIQWTKIGTIYIWSYSIEAGRAWHFVVAITTLLWLAVVSYNEITNNPSDNPLAEARICRFALAYFTTLLMRFLVDLAIFAIFYYPTTGKAGVIPPAVTVAIYAVIVFTALIDTRGAEKRLNASKTSPHNT